MDVKGDDIVIGVGVRLGVCVPVGSSGGDSSLCGGWIVKEGGVDGSG